MHQLKVKMNFRMELVKRLTKNLFGDVKLRVIRFFISPPDIILSFANTIGDDLLCTIPARQLKEKYAKKVWILTAYPELFKGNPFVDRAIKKNDGGVINSTMKRFISHAGLKPTNPWYTSYNNATDQDVSPSKHIIEIMCDKVKVEPPEIIKPYFFLTKREKKKGKFYKDQICIHSSGLGARHHMNNKDWFVDRFEEVVSRLNRTYTVVQIGLLGDPLLKGVIDLRGKAIRETGAILYNSKLFIGQVGFLMHLARSVDCPSVIVYGGRESPRQTGYKVNINLYSETSCSPCWYSNYCPNKKICMEMVQVDDVITAAEKLLTLHQHQMVF